MRLEPATPGGTRTRNPQIKNSDAAPPLGIEPRTWWLTATRSAKRSREDSNPRPKGSDTRASNGDWTVCLVALLCRPNGHGARLLNEWTCPCGLESHRRRNFNFRRDSNPPPQAGRARMEQLRLLNSFHWPTAIDDQFKSRLKQYSLEEKG